MSAPSTICYPGRVTATVPEGERASAGPADFLLIAGRGTLATHALGRAELLIGRDPACDVVIDDPGLSRRHAVLRPGPPLTIQDLGSTNGVRIGEQVVRGGAPIALAPGASFHLGPFACMVTAGGAAAAPSSGRSGVERLRIDDPTVDGLPPFVRDVAATRTSVLILGETGVGKDVLAESLHALSRRTGAMARINCAALAEPLIESELFGHERGAFTGAAATKVGLLESAEGGTVFLDEIGELPIGTQAKLLRAIEAREVVRLGATRPIKIDVRFVAATNRDLPAEIAARRFRQDLYYRLDGIALVIPPLRERRARIVPLATRFLAEACAQLGRPPLALSLELAAALEAHPWPGNTRELKAVIERGVLLARGGELGVRHLAIAPMATSAAPAAPVAPVVAPADGGVAVDAAAAFLAALSPAERAERQRVVDALAQCGGNQSRAAQLLGVSRSTLVNRIKQYRIARPHG